MGIATKDPTAVNTALMTIGTEGSAQCLYTEALPLHTLGTLHVKRWSEIEYNNHTSQWEVYLVEEKRIGYRNISREACLKWEKDYFNQQGCT